MSWLWGLAEDGQWVTVEVSAGDPADIAQYWPRHGLGMVVSDPGVDPALRYEVDASSAISLAELESDLGLFSAEHLSRDVAVHAAVIKAEGQLILFPGPSLAGKTSLCVAAHELGYEVWSDEYALIDPLTGRVAGWPRPVRVRTLSGWQRRELVTLHEPAMVAVVAVLTYQPDDAECEGVSFILQPLDPGAVAMQLLANTICAQLRPEASLAAASAVARTCQGLQGDRGEAAAALESLVRHLQS